MVEDRESTLAANCGRSPLPASSHLDDRLDLKPAGKPTPATRPSPLRWLD